MILSKVLVVYDKFNCNSYESELGCRYVLFCDINAQIEITLTSREIIVEYTNKK